MARRGEEAFDRIAQLLAPGNRSWAPAAGTLILLVTRSTDETGRPRPWARCDTGLAVAALAVQAEFEELSVDQMGGFDADAARRTFGLDDAQVPVVVIAVGQHEPHAGLAEPLATLEHGPRSRGPLRALLLNDRQARRTT